MQKKENKKTEKAAGMKPAAFLFLSFLFYSSGSF